MQTPVIQCRDLSFAYGDEAVLQDVNFSLPQGDFACFVGPNGGGKTTLLKLLLGLLTPQRGEISILGKAPGKARRDIGYLPQSPHLDQLFPINVMDIVLMGRLGLTRSWGAWTGDDRASARASLESVGLGDLENRRFGTLSGGQQQRVLIGRALACRPRLLLLDEPTANLDRHVEEHFYELLAALNRELTIVIVSHDLAFVSRYVRNVVCVKNKVQRHPTADLDETLLGELFGHGVKLVRHDHAWSNGHECTDECDGGQS